MSDLPKRLRIKAGMIALGERVAWGSDTALMEEAADVIEALSASVENHQLHMLGMARDRDQLRAMLTAQPQARACVTCGEPTRFDKPYCEEHCYELPQASAAQSAPAGEREAVAYEHWKADMEPYGFGGLDAFQAGASWQRTQSAGVPDVSAMARVLSDRSADACNIDRTDNWAMYGQEYIEDVQAVLAASPAPEAQRFAKPSLLKDSNVTYSNSSKPLALGRQAERQEPAPDADQIALVAANDIVRLVYGEKLAASCSSQFLARVQCRVLDWIKAAQQSAPERVSVPRELVQRAARHLNDWLELDQCECEGPHYCGRTQVAATNRQLRALLAAAPARPAAQDQGEVQRLREALSRARDVLQIMRQHEDQPNGYKYPVSLWFPAIDAALSASTGQEVEK